MLYWIATSVSLFLLARWILGGDPRPVNGVYSLPGTWYPIKYALFRLLMQLRRRQNASKAEVTSGDGAGYGMRSRSSPGDMDKPQDLSPEHPLAVDAVYFNGGDRNGTYLVAATARRHNNIVQTILLIRIPDVGLLEFPTLPETNLEGTHPGEFAAGGLKLEAVEPMKTWKLTFSGKLRLQRTMELLEVKFSLDWTALTKYFDFDTDLHPAVMCDAIAREKWSRQFFDTLKRSHQTHYEQFGEITGNIDIEKHGIRNVKLQGVRDHSYGNKRDWSSFHRYILQYAYMEDGTSVCFGAICIPNLMSRWQNGRCILYRFRVLHHGRRWSPA
ncbi:uncharacterized protein LOC135461674 isoform X2 [Liolophura sinensis]|uniref:uncharacterized protein LOC135461674 isoform X2 n=1 Tax=Liolophura sinensis TaxID=3198878 RepID=UPI0031588D01